MATKTKPNKASEKKESTKALNVNSDLGVELMLAVDVVEKFKTNVARLLEFFTKREDASVYLASCKDEAVALMVSLNPKLGERTGNGKTTLAASQFASRKKRILNAAYGVVLTSTQKAKAEAEKGAKDKAKAKAEKDARKATLEAENEIVARFPELEALQELVESSIREIAAEKSVDDSEIVCALIIRLQRSYSKS